MAEDPSPEDFSGSQILAKRAYRWKGMLSRAHAAGGEAQHTLRGHYRFHLPQAMGIGDDGVWRWKLLPVQLDIGGHALLGQCDDDGRPVVEIEPFVRLKTKRWQQRHGITATAQLLPCVSLSLKKAFETPFGRLHLRVASQGRFLGQRSLSVEWRKGAWDGGMVHASASAQDLGRFTVLSQQPPVMKGQETVSPGDITALRHGVQSIRLKHVAQPRRGVWLSLSGGIDSPSIPLEQNDLSRPSTPRGAAAAAAAAGRSAKQLPPVSFCLSASFLGDRFGRDIQSLDVIGAETQRWQLQGGEVEKGKKQAVRRIGVVAGHWIDPGEATGAPGEQEFNMDIADALASKLSLQGWIVYRPDKDAKGLEWDDYLRWVARQSRRGTPVIEIHGQGRDASIAGVTTGVIGCQAAPLNKALASSFGFFPMDWKGLAVPRQGGVIIESFVTDEVNELADDERERMAQQLGGQICEAVHRADSQARANRLQIESGCSTTGCPIGRYGHELEEEALEANMLEPTHPIRASPLLSESMEMDSEAEKAS